MDSTLALDVDDEGNKENIIRTTREHLLKNPKISLKEIWWGNMLLLGFCPADNERKYGTVFHKDMFEQANTKGMQVVLYFLLRLINRDLAKKVSSSIVTRTDKGELESLWLLLSSQGFQELLADANARCQDQSQ